MIPKNRLYKRTGKATFKLNIPVTLLRSEVRSSYWADAKAEIVDEVFSTLDAALGQIEKDIRNKK